MVSPRWALTVSWRRPSIGGIDHRKHLRGDQRGVVDEQHPALGHRDYQRAVDELVAAVVGLGVLADVIWGVSSSVHDVQHGS
jgi:hypothetical protein